MVHAHKIHPIRRRAPTFASLRDPLYRSSYALLANTAATTVVGVGFWAVAAHFYDQQALGRGAALVSALMLVSSFGQLNLANALPRFIPGAGQRAGKLIVYSYGASTCAALIGGLAFVVILPQLSSQWEFLTKSLSLTIAFVVGAAVWEVFTLQDMALLSLRRPALVPIENFIYGLLKLLMLVFVVSLMPSTGIFVSWVLPLAVTVPAVNWFIFQRYLKERTTAPVSGGFRPREVLRFVSVDYIGTLLAQTYGNLLPLLVVSTLGAAANSGFYIAWTITSGLGLVAFNFGTSLLVEGASEPDRLADLTRGVLVRCVVITSLCAALLIFAARPILDIYGSRYAVHTTSLLSLLALGTIPNCLIVVALSLDRIAGRVGRATLTRLILTILVLGGSWLLVRRDGIDGVAFAWGGANLVVALARFPTIARAARRRGALAPKRIPVQRTLAGPPPAASMHADRLGLHRRHVAGRHRAGVLLAERTQRPNRSSRTPLSSATHAPTVSEASQSADQSTRALELLISLGTRV